MTTPSLANAYRPRRLAELVGQPVLVDTLTYALQNQAIAHAYILTGIRGVGKTTTARVIARSLNCEQGPTPTPCLHCVQCRAIDEDRHPDLLEIDAASNSSVDQARQMIQSIGTRPLMGRYRIRVIDEAHGLSDKAWDAWLKPIEEPPPHEIFIFATTESNKIPATIRSRSRLFALSRIDPADLQSRINVVATDAGIPMEAGASALLARMASGSMRDGLTLLGQARDHGQGRVTVANIERMLGLPAYSDAIDLIHAVLSHQPQQVLSRSQAMLRTGVAPDTLVKILLDVVYTIGVGQIDEQVLVQLGHGPDDVAAFTRLGRLASVPQIQAAYTELSRVVVDLKDAPNTESAVLMGLLRMMPRT